MNAMEKKARVILRESDVTGAQVAGRGWGDGNEIAVEKIGFHAFSVHAEADGPPAAEKRGTELDKQARILPDDRLRPGHDG
jgi:hypothetical protein